MAERRECTQCGGEDGDAEVHSVGLERAGRSGTKSHASKETATPTDRRYSKDTPTTVMLEKSRKRIKRSSCVAGAAKKVQDLWEEKADATDPESDSLS